MKFVIYITVTCFFLIGNIYAQEGYSGGGSYAGPDTNAMSEAYKEKISAEARAAGQATEAKGKQEAWKTKCEICATDKGADAIKSGSVGTGGIFGGYLFDGCDALLMPPCADNRQQATGSCCEGALRTDCLSDCKKISSINTAAVLTGVGVAGGLGGSVLSTIGQSGSGGGGSSGSSGSGTKYNDAPTSSLFSGGDIKSKCGQLSGTDQTKCFCQSNGWTFDTTKNTCNDSKTDTGPKTLDTTPSTTTASALADNSSADKGGSPGGSGSGAGGGSGSADPSSGGGKAGAPGLGGAGSDGSGKSLRDLAMENQNRINNGSGSIASSSYSDENTAENKALKKKKELEAKKKFEEDKRIETYSSAEDIFFIVNKPIRIRYEYKQIMTEEGSVNKGKQDRRT